ncbi:hypothetical protein MMC22_005797 [Lobaria immixta]|nr:hypothetical protein [Lobaria immixta]
MRIDQAISYGYLSTKTTSSQPAFLATDRLLIRSGQPPACQLSLRPFADYDRIIDHPINFSDLNRDSDQPSLITVVSVPLPWYQTRKTIVALKNLLAQQTTSNGLETNFERFALPPSRPVPEDDDEERRTERIYQRPLKVKDFTDDAGRTVAKLGLRPYKRNPCPKKTQKTFGNVHLIRPRDFRNAAESISKVCDISFEINDLHVPLDEAINIHTLKSHDSMEKEHFLTLEVLAKALKYEELRLAD